MDTALIIGGTRFIGRHTVGEFLAHEYEVTIFNRGEHPNPFEGDDRVTHVEGDRSNDGALELARDQVDPAVVIDCVAYQPRDVRAATTIFDDVTAYVYISSGAAYAEEAIPKREDETTLESCTREQATDDSMETYGNRKAEGDRAVKAAADSGVQAMGVRPCIVYGPHDYTERLDYWIDRVKRFDRVVVPGDGDNLWHRVYVDDVASALRIVAENGKRGSLYNVGDRRLQTLQELVESLAEIVETDVEVVPAGERELGAGGLSPEDFILYREYPHVMSTTRLADLGWESTPVREALTRSVEAHRTSDRDGSDHDPGREVEQRVLYVLETV